MFYIYADGEMIYHLANEDLYLRDPTLDMELGKAGSLEFGILPDHAAYNKLSQMKTIVTVDYDNQEIFRGRVLSNKRNFDNSRTVYCEGDLSYLIDSVQKCEKYSGTTHALFRKIIAAHNARVEPYKQFTVGNITIEDRPIELVGQSDDLNVGTIDYKQIAIDSIVGEWNNTYDFIETCLIDWCGGYLKTRHVNGVTYIDYVQSYTTTCTQPIEIGLNMLDLEEEVTAEDLFTVLIPLGDDNITIESVNGGSDELVDTNAVAQYGRIVQTHVFPNVNEPSTLLENARRYLASNVNVPRTLTIKAIDLHIFNKDIMQINLGTRVNIRSTPHSISEYLTCTEIEYKFEDPSNTVYTFGNQKQTLTERYREDKRKQSDLYGNGGGSGGKSSSGGGMMGWHLRDAAGAVGEEAEKEQEDAIKEFFNAYIATDPTHGDITLEAVYQRIENAVTVLKSQCGIYIDADPEHSNVNVKTLYTKVDENTGAIATTRTVIDQLATDTQANISIVAQAAATNSADIANNKSSIASLRLTANSQGESIVAINANVIKLNGKVATLEANEASIDRLKSKISSINSLAVNSGSVQGTWSVNGTLRGSSIVTGNDEPVYSYMHYHTLSCNSSGVVTLGVATQTGPTSFNLADTTFYKAGVSAAEQAVRVKDIRLNPDSEISFGSSTKTLYVPVQGNTTKYATYHHNVTLNVDATEAVNSVTLSSSSIELNGSATYQNGYKRYAVPVKATASNGKSSTNTLYVSATDAFNAGVNTFEAVSVNVLGSAVYRYTSDGSSSGTNVGSSVNTTYLYYSYDGVNYYKWSPSSSVYYEGSDYYHPLRGDGGYYYNSGGAQTYYRKKS